MTTLTQTGARLVHDGQFDGRKVRLPVFLGRYPAEREYGNGKSRNHPGESVQSQRRTLIVLGQGSEHRRKVGIVGAICLSPQQVLSGMARSSKQKARRNNRAIPR